MVNWRVGEAGGERLTPPAPPRCYRGMIEVLIRREIAKAIERLGGSPKLVASLRGASRRRLHGALELLGADRELLATVRSWQDGGTDENVLATLRAWNGRAAGDAFGAARPGHGALEPAAKS